jgi:glutathione-regulated potassium-efflux system ancillary protein KefG
VDVSELIDAAEVARVLGLSHRNSVTTYLRRYGDMPRPVLERSEGKTRLWLRSEVVAWAEATGREPAGDAA